MDQPSCCSAPLSTLYHPLLPRALPPGRSNSLHDLCAAVHSVMAAWPCNPSKDFAAFQDARARMQLLFFFFFFPPVTRVSLFAGSIPLVPGSISLVPGCISLSLSLDGTEMLGLLRQMARSDLCLLASQPAPFPCLTFLSFFALSSSLSLFFFFLLKRTSAF